MKKYTAIKIETYMEAKKAEEATTNTEDAKLAAYQERMKDSEKLDRDYACKDANERTKADRLRNLQAKYNGTFGLGDDCNNFKKETVAAAKQTLKEFYADSDRKANDLKALEAKVLAKRTAETKAANDAANELDTEAPCTVVAPYVKYSYLNMPNAEFASYYTFEMKTPGDGEVRFPSARKNVKEYRFMAKARDTRNELRYENMNMADALATMMEV